MPRWRSLHADLGRLVLIVAAAIEAAVESAYGGAAEQPETSGQARRLTRHAAGCSLEAL